MGHASCESSATYNFEVGARFIENFCTPGLCYRLGSRVSWFNTIKGQQIFFSSPKNSDQLWEPITLLLNGSWGFPQGYSSQGMKREFTDLCQGQIANSVNPLTPNDHYSGRTAPLTSKRCILYIYLTNIDTEYFKHGTYSPFFSLFKMQFVS